jgi:hypothetical protein
MVDELLEQDIVRPSKSPYVSPGYLLPKKWADFRMVVDYSKENAKVSVDSYPISTIEQSFEQFLERRCSVLNLNSDFPFLSNVGV